MAAEVAAAIATDNKLRTTSGDLVRHPIAVNKTVSMNTSPPAS